MNPAHAGAHHWQEATYWRICATLAKHESDRRHYLTMARQATADQRMAEGNRRTLPRGRTT